MRTQVIRKIKKAQEIRKLKSLKVKKIPDEWRLAKGIWPDKIDPLKYQRKMRKEYAY